jgi:hypothetical protein
MDDGQRAARGMTVRREVLGDAHVDRAVRDRGAGAVGGLVTARELSYRERGGRFRVSVSRTSVLIARKYDCW